MILASLALACTADDPVPTDAHPKAKATSWSPGDPIPGWEDFACTEPLDAGHATVEIPGLVTSLVYIVGPESGPDDIDHRGFRLVFADCETVSCKSAGSYPYNAALAIVILDDEAGGLDSRGQGLYAGTRGADLHTWSEGTTDLFTWMATGQGKSHIDTATSEVCLSRVRPDEIAGVLTVNPDRIGKRKFPWQMDFEVRIPFRFPLVDHAGQDGDDSTEGFEPPEGATLLQYLYNRLDYDYAWPWDLITDPDIRQAVYDRYTPWNTR